MIAGGGYAGTTELVAQPSTAPTPDDPGGRGDDFGKSSPVGLVVLIVFVIAVIFLIRSMNKHLKRVPESFDHLDDRGRPVEQAEPDKPAS